MVRRVRGWGWLIVYDDEQDNYIPDLTIPYSALPLLQNVTVHNHHA